MSDHRVDEHVLLATGPERALVDAHAEGFEAELSVPREREQLRDRGQLARERDELGAAHAGDLNGRSGCRIPGAKGHRAE